MRYEDIKNLPQDAEIIVSQTFVYHPEDITAEIYNYWMRNGAIITNEYKPKHEEDAIREK